MTAGELMLSAAAAMSLLVGQRVHLTDPVAIPGRRHGDDRFSGERPVWVLLGRRTGDNNQLLAAAESLGLPYRAIPLRFRALSLPNLIAGKSLRSLRNPGAIPEGDPAIVLSVGRRPVPVVRWIRQRSGGTTRLVHFGRPWAPVSWFDLVVTTAQYGLGPAGNIVCNALPFIKPPKRADIPGSLHERFDRMPRPWTVVMVGGDSRPYVFDRRAAERLAAHASATVQQRGGSLFVVPSPRTRQTCIRTIDAMLPPGSFLYRRNEHENPYSALLHEADHLIVTSDSATMVSEALVSAKPVELFELQQRPDFRYRIARAWQRAASWSYIVKKIYYLLLDRGLLTSTRDLRKFYQRLRHEGAFDDAAAVAALARKEREETIRRVRSLLS